MRKERNQKRICLLLVLAVMISGICLEKIPTNSYFSCKETTAIAKADNVVRNVSAHQTETLSEKEVLSSIRATEKNIRRNPTRTSGVVDVCLFNREVRSRNFQSKYTEDSNDSYYRTLCSAVILSYIHKQDGEKEAHLNFS